MFAVMMKTGSRRSYRWWRMLKRLRASRDGAAAIEFAILAIPYLMIVFAIFETFIAYIAQDVVDAAVDKLGREIRTGAITYNQGLATDMTSAQFRQAFCNEISYLLSCDASEVSTPDRLYLDVRSFSAFSSLPTSITKTSSGSLDTSSFAFTPGGASTYTMLRAYYFWPITADIIRPYISNIHRASESVNSDYLIVSTSVFQNEAY
ncbi:TadE/TadG family type IV pilus assembly protein [Allorhizobium sonneratiae]|uniref:TadE/TadG family type IV pilus assembly protein n=1 Tax=Allorhizobium sonneratiae TaxID=2934936 RepID=UPI003B8487A3